MVQDMYEGKLVFSQLMDFVPWTKRLRRGTGSGRKRLPVVRVFDLI